jgi:hypothetical protein
MRTIHWLFVTGALLFVFGIGFVVVGARSARSAPAPETAPIAPVATVKQIMNGIIDPAATKVFDSVSTSATEKGIEEIAPANDQEWAALGDQAAALAEAGNRLLMEGRAVDRGDWRTMSTAMIDAAKQTMKAAEAKSADAVLDAGSNLNTTCDNCHARYRRQ